MTLMLGHILHAMTNAVLKEPFLPNKVEVKCKKQTTKAGDGNRTRLIVTLTGKIKNKQTRFQSVSCFPNFRLSSTTMFKEMAKSSTQGRRRRRKGRSDCKYTVPISAERKEIFCLYMDNNVVFMISLTNV